MAIGTADMAVLSPREIFKGALLNNATRIILIHNHPSGSAEPSCEDEQIENALREAGELLAIPVIDFLIIGEDEWYWSSVDGKQQLGDPGTMGALFRVTTGQGGDEDEQA